MDLFSTQFQFTINKEKNGKQTIIGKFLTIASGVLTLLFLIYLSKRFLVQEMLPKITEVTKINRQENLYTYEETPLSFRFITNDPNVPADFDYTRFFKFSIFSGNAFQNTIEFVEPQKCLDMYPDRANQYKDIDLCAPKSIQVGIEYDKVTKQNSENTFGLVIYRCQDDPDCATSQEVTDFIETYQFYILVTQYFQQYDYDDRELKPITSEIFVNLDSYTMHYVQYSMIKAVNQIDKDPILSNYETYEYITGQTHYGTYMRQALQHKYHQLSQFNTVYAFYNWGLNFNTQSIKVEYPKFTEITAQVVSIFNILIAIGFIGKYASEVKLFEQVMENYIQFYYQKSVTQLPPEGNTLLNYNIFQSIKNYFINLKFMKKLTKKRKQQFDTKFTKSDICEPIKKHLSKEELYHNIFELVQDQFELDQIFKDIFLLKNCVQLLLSKEQYAAIKYIGRNIPKKEMVRECTEKQFRELNHLEQLDIIDRNNNICQKLFLEFRDRQNLDQGIFDNNQKFTALQSQTSLDLNRQQNSVDKRIKKSLLSDEEIKQYVKKVQNKECNKLKDCPFRRKKVVPVEKEVDKFHTGLEEDEKGFTSKKILSHDMEILDVEENTDNLENISERDRKNSLSQNTNK